MTKKNLLLRTAVYSLLLIISGYVFYNEVYSPDNSVIDSSSKNKDLDQDKFNLKYSSLRSAGMSPEEFAKNVELYFPLMPDLRLANAFFKFEEILNPGTKVTGFKMEYSGDELVIIKDAEQIVRFTDGYSWKEYFRDSDKYLNKRLKEANFNLKKNPQSFPGLEILEKQVDSFEISEILSAVKKLNELHAKTPNDLEVFRSLTRGIISLALYSSSYFLDGTLLEAKALSMFTILKRFCESDCDREEMMIAFLLRYADHISSVTSKSNNDLAISLRLYQSNDIEGFYTHLKHSKKSLVEVLVFFLLLYESKAADNQYEYYIQELARHHSYSVIPVAYRAFIKGNTFSLGLKLSLSNLALTQKENLSKPVSKAKTWMLNLISPYLGDDFASRYLFESLNMPFSSVVDQIDESMTDESLNYKERVFNDDDYSLFQKSFLYDAVVKTGDFYINTKASKVESEEYLKQIKDLNSSHGKLAYAFLLLQQNLKFHHIETLADFDRITRFHVLSPHSYYVLLTKLHRTIGEKDPQMPVAALRLSRKIDTRPHHIQFIEAVHGRILLNPRKIGIHRGMHTFNQRYGEKFNEIYSKIQNGIELLPEQILNEPGVKLPLRLWLLKAANLWSALDKEIKIKFLEGVIDIEPQNYNYVYELAQLYSDEKDFKTEREILLKRAPYFESSSGLEYIRMMTNASLASLKLKEYKQAEEDLKPAINSGTGDSMYAMAEVLSSQGDHHEASRIIMKAYNRYGSQEFLAQRIKYELRKGDFKTASKVYFEYEKDTLNISFHQILGKVFNSELERDNNFSFRDLIKEISAHGETKYLLPNLFMEIPGINHESLILELLFSSRPQSLSFDRDIYLVRYTDNWEKFIPAEKALRYFLNVFTYFDRLNKPLDGLNYIKANFGEQYLPFVILASLDNVKLQSLIELVHSLKDKADPFVHLAHAVIAGRALRSSDIDPSGLIHLKEFYSDPSMNSFYYQAGRYLFYGDNYDQLVKLSDAENKRVSLFYFLGVHCDANHDLRSAAKWFRAAMFEGTYAYERYWSFDEAQWLNYGGLTELGILRKRLLLIEKQSNKNPYKAAQVEKISAMISKIESSQ